MLGFADFWVALAYWLCLGSTLLCVIYGWWKWNEDETMPQPPRPTPEDLEFEENV
jgi:hypothetical protein